MSQAWAVSPNEREDLVAKLELSRERFLTAIAGVDEQEERICPVESSWSILQIAEHLALVEARLRTLWVEKAQPGTTAREWDEKYRNLGRNRQEKREAPEAARPTGAPESLEKAREGFIKERAETIRLVRSEARELREHVLDHRLGLMDGYQFFTLLAAHTDRHAEQAMEVKEKLRSPE